MSSTVACIGFTDPSSLAALVRESGEPFHELSSTYRWSDTSGATLLLDRTAQYARPGFATSVRTPYANLTAGASGLASITLLDQSGFDLDRFSVVPDARYTVGWNAQGRVALVAMGIDVEFFPTAEDFFDSPRSALPGFDSEPPPEVKQFGLAWPPTMEIETFMPAEKENDPTATLSGTVQFADVRKNSHTGHEFLVARIATVIGEIDLCTPLPLEGAPEPGSVTVGQVQLLAGFGPFGEEDTAPYTPTQAQDRVGPNFRDGEPIPAEDAPVTEEIELPEGLVLGDDGVVRTADQHAAWKGGDEHAGSGPENASGAAPADDDATSDDEDDQRREFHGNIAPDEVDAQGNPVVTESAPTSKAAEPVGADQEKTPEPAQDEDDSAPRPGETRREWRARTGR